MEKGENMDKCAFCTGEAVDQVEFEAGNNAEVGIYVDVCQVHLDEIDNDTDYTFQGRHSDVIESIAADKLMGGYYGE